MKNNISKFPLFLLITYTIFFGFSCSKKYQKGTLYFGSGGGFTGSYKEFQLNANGDIYFQQSGVDTVIFFFFFNSTATKKLFKEYCKLKLDSEDFYTTGNMYYYVGRRESKFRNHKITFGNPEAGVTTNIKEYYDDFNKIISENNSNK